MISNIEVVYQGKIEGAKPLQNLYFPLSPLKERGIQGVRLINNL